MQVTKREFIKGLEDHDVDLIRKIPKSDLHSHSKFGCRRESLEKWIGHPVQKPPEKMKNLEAMIEYTDLYLNRFLKTRKGVEFSTQASLKQNLYDGVELLEMSIDSSFVHYYKNHEIGLIRHIEETHKNIAPEMRFKPEIGMVRERDIKEISRQVEPCIESGYFHGIDLYGIESARTPDTYKALFRKAKTKGMKLKAHVGEFGDAESVRHTVEILELDEVQHGIGAAGSKEVMRWLRDNNIRLNVCPTSNVMLSRVESIGVHPMRVLFDHGVNITINTDDIMIFDQSVSDEYLNLYKAKLFSATELDRIRMNGLACQNA